MSHYRMRDASGVLLHEQMLEAGSVAVRRRDLLAALLAVLPEGVLTLDAALQHLDWDEQGGVAAAWLSSGERVKADLYVAADGVRSTARTALYPQELVSQARVMELVGLIRSAELTRWLDACINKFHNPQGGLACGLVPVGGDHVVWYLQFDALRYSPPNDDAHSIDRFVRALMAGWAARIQQALELTDFSEVHLWRPIDTDLVAAFHRGNVVLVGDAAHPLSPFTSQGVSAAIADVLALVDALDADDLSLALTSYSIERRAGCARYVDQGRRLTERFLAPLAWSGEVIPMAK